VRYLGVSRDSFFAQKHSTYVHSIEAAAAAAAAADFGKYSASYKP
jgi:hypothetical protein